MAYVKKLPAERVRPIAQLALCAADEAALRDAAWRAHLTLGVAMRQACMEWVARQSAVTSDGPKPGAETE